MGYDLFIWPADAAVSPRQAMAKLRRLLEADRPGPPRDHRLAAFAAEVERRNPWMASTEEPPADVTAFEFSVYRDYAFVGIFWDDVVQVGTEVDELARGHGLLVLDPQSQSVALPDALGGAPLNWAAALEGREQFHELTRQMGEAFGVAADPAEAMRSLREDLAAQGFRISSPMGFDITPGMEAELFADPTRMPSSLQTPEARDRLLRDVRSTKRGPRTRALAQLAGWDPDPAVAATLREILDSDDEGDRFFAVSGIARQRDVGSLDAVVAVLEREAAASGGDRMSMLSPCARRSTSRRSRGRKRSAGSGRRARPSAPRCRGGPTHWTSSWRSCSRSSSQLGRLAAEPCGMAQTAA